MKKIRMLKWMGQDIFFWENWKVLTKMTDPMKASGFRDLEIKFQNWDDIKWADKISLPLLYQDAFPEFVEVQDGTMKFNKDLLDELFPDTELLFDIDEESLVSINKKKKSSHFDPQGHEYHEIIWEEEKEQDAPFDLKKFKEDLKIELKAEIMKEILIELKAATEENTEIPKWYIIQKFENWTVANTYKNASIASKETWISKSSISQCLKGTTKTAGKYFWVKN